MSKKKVLIVDDCEIIRKQCSRILIKMGFNVKLASNGLEAIEQVKLYHPDVVILDIIMPEMNGYQVCRQIKSHPQTKNISVIFCSSKCSEVDIYWGMKQGADGYISKPVKKDKLITLMSRFSGYKNEIKEYSDQSLYQEGRIQILPSV
ncbi:response regulator [Okeania sp.]|uniref:response regulator n=1 Tax=Okeania sp. TaxID=3100323 RepID=UPI002B4AF00B|nr:response regulator [Okeania sp.]MEB3340081.1 response regulator [Okeania sp.]